jgi:hypothetical protein
MSLQALQRRVKRLEAGEKSRPSPFTLWYGSFNAWVETQVLPGIDSGALDGADMIVVVAMGDGWHMGAGTCSLTETTRCGY